MDRGDQMALSGSASYYMQQRGIAAGSGAQPELHVSHNIRPLSNPNNLPFSSSIGGGGGNIGSTLPLESSAISPHGVNMGSPTVAPPSGETVKRKRGRPRKYGSDGNVSLALSPTSSSHPGTFTQSQKRGRGRPPGSGRKQQLAPLGALMSGSVGMGFTPHVINIANGEDIATKIMAFSQQGPRAVCILSATGAVSTVTLRQSSTSGGSVTYEGRFEILCLSGSYLLTDSENSENSGSSRNRSGGLSISLANPDGRVIGGGVGGVLIASGPVQVIVGSFIWGGSKTKNKKKEGSEAAEVAVVGSDHQAVQNPVTLNNVSQNQNLTPTSSLSPWSASPRPLDMRSSHVDIDLMRG